MFIGANLLLSNNEIKACQELIQNSKFLVTNLQLNYDTVLSSLQIAKGNNGKKNRNNNMEMIYNN